jgi:dethiobiotin synthase
MMRGLFVTGTDTNVGKTVASAALMLRLGAAWRMRYWKPIQTGIEQDDDTATVRTLARLDAAQALDDGVRLERPLSPHLSARLAGAAIDPERLVAIAAAQDHSSRWIVEGAGGVFVPLNDDDLMIDLMVRLGLPAVIAARSTLGTINHTLLTVEALRQRGLQVAGVMMIGAPDAENRAAIERYGEVAVVGELPLLDPLTPEGLRQAAAALDPEDALGRVLQ